MSSLSVSKHKPFRHFCLAAGRYCWRHRVRSEPWPVWCTCATDRSTRRGARWRLNTRTLRDKRQLSKLPSRRNVLITCRRLADATPPSAHLEPSPAATDRNSLDSPPMTWCTSGRELGRQRGHSVNRCSKAMRSRRQPRAEATAGWLRTPLKAG